MINSALIHPAGALRVEHVRQLEKLPRRFIPAIQKKWAEIHKKTGRLYDANVMLREAVETLGDGRFSVAASEDELRNFAKARAGECFRVAGRYMDADMALHEMERVAQRYGINPPEGNNVTKQGKRARLLCEKWWRRAVRRYVTRKVEGAAITLGLVHRRAGLYVSDEGLAQRIAQKQRNRALLESIVAVNDAGDEYTLQALSDLGTSNPEIRRGELMTRLAGFDQLAKAAGHAAEFYTLTAPSKYHARDSISGKENPKYNGATPRETQAYLCEVWAKVRAALHRRGVRLYGFRVAEPHHDGTTHWHMVIFCEAGNVQTVREVFKRYAMAVDGGEKGASIHRFKAEAIDRSRGTAAGYLAKYIAKNIDGYGVGEDWEAVAGQDDAKSSAARVDAWASRWGIRQFQQVGGAPVSVWRELRRLDVSEAGNWAMLESLIAAADLGGKLPDGGELSGWALFVNLMGGPMAKRGDMPARCYRVGGVNVQTGEIKFNAYGEIAAPVVKGLDCWGAGVVETRVREWVFQRRGKAASPWSSVNNCTRADWENAENRCAERLAESVPAFSPVDFGWKSDFLQGKGAWFEHKTSN